MSNTKREPLLSDVDILYPLTADLTGIEYAKQMGRREGHTAARAKDAELIQQLVDALVEQKKWLTWIPLHHMDDADQSECIADGKRSDNALSTAAAQGFTTTPEP